MLRLFLKKHLIFSDSAYRKYLTASYSYDYEYGGVDDDDTPAANPETTVITPVTRKDATIPTNYPIATREHKKAMSVLFGVSVLLFLLYLIQENKAWHKVLRTLY